jgi:hypothetical protein
MHSLNVLCSNVTSHERLVTMSTGVWRCTGIFHKLYQHASLTRLLMPSSMLCSPKSLVASWMISTIHLSGHPIHLDIYILCRNEHTLPSTRESWIPIFVLMSFAWTFSERHARLVYLAKCV